MNVIDVQTGMLISSMTSDKPQRYIFGVTKDEDIYTQIHEHVPLGLVWPI